MFVGKKKGRIFVDHFKVSQDFQKVRKSVTLSDMLWLISWASLSTWSLLLVHLMHSITPLLINPRHNTHYHLYLYTWHTITPLLINPRHNTQYHLYLYTWHTVSHLFSWTQDKIHTITFTCTPDTQYHIFTHKPKTQYTVPPLFEHLLHNITPLLIINPTQYTASPLLVHLTHSITPWLITPGHNTQYHTFLYTWRTASHLYSYTCGSFWIYLKMPGHPCGWRGGWGGRLTLHEKIWLNTRHRLLFSATTTIILLMYFCFETFCCLYFRHHSLWLQNNSCKTSVKETITWSWWTEKLQTYFQIYHFCQNSWRNLFLTTCFTSVHTIYSASISLLTNPGTAWRLFSFVYSTTFTVPLMITKFHTSLDDYKISVLLLLDLYAAFNATDHKLFSCLEHDFGIHSTTLYLSDRKQYRNILRLRCSPRLCIGPLTVHSAYTTTNRPQWKTQYTSWNVCRWYKT